MHRTPRFVATCALVAAFACGWVSFVPGCKDRTSRVEEVFRVPYTTLVLPRVDGWEPASDVRPTDGDAGGLMMRLVQRSAVPGSPRIEVILEPKQSRATTLADFTDRNLREMAALEQAGKIHILHVAQQPTQVGAVPAWRAQHEFTLGQGKGQVSLYQVSTFCVFNGRGVSITASGRTELFHPLAGSIARLLEGITFGQGTHPAAAASEAAGAIDLGRLGGQR